MKKNIGVQNLPEEYHKIDQFDLNENRGLVLILNLVGLGVLFGVGWLLVQSLTLLRPEYLSSENVLVITGMREFWRGILLLVASLGLMIVLNESIRGLIFLILTHRFPNIRLRGFFQAKYSSNWYLPRWAYLTIRLLPILIITILGLGSVPLVPLNLVPGVLLLVAMDIATSTGDFLTTYWLLQRPKNILVQDNGDCIDIFQVKKHPIDSQ
jgi:hypothetical protein